MRPSRSPSARSGRRSARRRSAAGTRSTSTRCSRSRPPSCATARSRCWRCAGSRPSTPARCDRYGELTAQLYRAILTVAGAQVVVDSTKNPPYAYFLRAARASGLRMRVLHLVRDSRGVVHSWMKRVARPEVTSGDGPTSRSSSPVPAGVRWMECNLAFELLRRLGAHGADAVRGARGRPAGEVARALRGARRARPTARPARRRRSVEVAGQHSVRGNPMRFAHGRQQVRADEAWRTGMARQTRSLVVAGDVAAAAPLRLSPPGVPVACEGPGRTPSTCACPRAARSRAGWQAYAIFGLLPAVVADRALGRSCGC